MSWLSRRFSLTSSAAALAAVTACGASTAPSTPTGASAAGPAVGRRIAILGDSLAVSPSRSVNFPAELQQRITAAGLPWSVHNAGVSGDTSAGGLRRLDDVLTADTDVMILALGANDGLRRVDIESIERNLSTIIERAQAAGVEVLLCGMETPPMNGWDYTVAFHRIFPRVAARYDVALVPFLLEGVALNPEMNGEDSIHPNAAGAKRIADTVWPHLQRVLQRASARI